MSPADFGREMAQRRRQGEAVKEEYKAPVFAYVTDTHTDVWLNPDHAWIFDVPIIITECSFLSPEEEEKAHKDGHTHWRGLEPVVRSHPNTLWVLIHFSLRYSDKYVIEFFREEEVKHGPLPNVMLWANPDPAMPEQHQPPPTPPPDTTPTPRCPTNTAPLNAALTVGVEHAVAL
eukprot:CAMPEP_0175833044 /NCGR_PEP_ID=MMETSP0107_2-20121207/15306_1 /TAXON_ID=195067 ORGANISM="Goniomonas pacifica, Strain CCMP1869" /NCGR_SAMPLE_ID=MMETSP0107_2 /ASSEMBLY_ACC=CAM_ASM_000203 /LENGTH=174 /DNA_ID=CAMNT_0017146159 /DNA_START=10 /DNA_END=535 /DNA_ORIENTATION=+